MATLFGSITISLFFSSIHILSAKENSKPDMSPGSSIFRTSTDPNNLAPITITETGWDYQCRPQKTVITGVGMGNGKETITNPQTIFLSPPLNEILFAQLTGRYQKNKGGPLPENIILTMPLLSPITLTHPTNNNLYAYSYLTHIHSANPIHQITATVNGKGESAKTARGFIVYGLQNTAQKWTSTGVLTNNYVHSGLPNQAVVTKVLQIPPLTAPENLSITVVVIDVNEEDARPVNIQAYAGGVSRDIWLEAPDEPRLNIVSLTLPDVPIGTDQVQVGLHSPPRQNGDSAVLAGIDVSFPCLVNMEPAGIYYLPLIIQSINATVKVTSYPSEGTVGLPITYTFQVENSSDKDIEELVLHYKLPENTQFHPSFSTFRENSFCHSREGGEIFCYIGDLKPNTSFSERIVLLPENTNPLTNYVTVSSLKPGYRTSTDFKLITKVRPCIDPNSTNFITRSVGPLLEGFEYCGELSDKSDYFFFDVGDVRGMHIRFKSYGFVLNNYIPHAQLAIYSQPTITARITYTNRYKRDLVLAPCVHASQHRYYLRRYTDTPNLGVTYTLSLAVNPTSCP